MKLVREGLTERERQIFREINDTLDDLGESFQTGPDYMGFLAGIAFYLAACSVGINDGREARPLAQMLADQIVKNTNMLLKRRGQ